MVEVSLIIDYYCYDVHPTFALKERICFETERTVHPHMMN